MRNFQALSYFEDHWLRDRRWPGLVALKGDVNGAHSDVNEQERHPTCTATTARKTERVSTIHDLCETRSLAHLARELLQACPNLGLGVTKSRQTHHV